MAKPADPQNTPPVPQPAPRRGFGAPIAPPGPAPAPTKE